LLEATAERAPTMANRLLALVRRMFNFAIEHDWIALNPCQTIKAPSKNVQRDRVLTEDEIARFWEATEQEQPIVRRQGARGHGRRRRYADLRSSADSRRRRKPGCGA